MYSWLAVAEFISSLKEKTRPKHWKIHNQIGSRTSKYMNHCNGVHTNVYVRWNIQLSVMGIRWMDWRLEWYKRPYSQIWWNRQCPIPAIKHFRTPKRNTSQKLKISKTFRNLSQHIFHFPFWQLIKILDLNTLWKRNRAIKAKLESSWLRENTLCLLP